MQDRQPSLCYLCFLVFSFLLFAISNLEFRRIPLRVSLSSHLHAGAVRRQPFFFCKQADVVGDGG